MLWIESGSMFLTKVNLIRKKQTTVVTGFKSQINFCATRGLYNTCIPCTAPVWITNATQVLRRLPASEHLSEAVCH